MDSQAFNDAIEVFAEAVSAELTSARPLRVTNMYVKRAVNSKYLYLRLRLGPETRVEEGSRGDTNEAKNTTDLEFTVSYDAFYQVPVLHYRVDDKVDFFRDSSAVDTHPILQTPYMVVHACETASTMATTRLEGSEYLKLWLALNLSALFPELQLRRAI